MFHIVWSEPVMGHVRYRRAQEVDDTGMEEARPIEVMGLRNDALDARVYITGVTVRSVQFMDPSGHLLRGGSGFMDTLPIGDLHPVVTWWGPSTWKEVCTQGAS